MCEVRVVAGNGSLRIERCEECRGYTLHLGPTSIRLDEATFRVLSGLFQKAAEEQIERWAPLEGHRWNSTAH